jgi:uncharacterized lipoprotein YmbA
MMRRFILIGPLLLVGCANEPPVQKVTVQSDSYCRIAKKFRWSRQDTPDSVTQMRRHNSVYRRICR